MPSYRPTVVTFANDWSTDPTSKHHLMRLLSSRADVVWVETSGMRTPTLNSSADWRRIRTKLRRMFGQLRRVSEGLHVLSPPSIPLPTNRFARRLNASLYRYSVRRALRRIGSRSAPVLWVYTPTVARYLHRFPTERVIYHCVDRWWSFADYDAAEMRACHEILCRRAERVFVSSRELERDCLAITDNVSYIPHGVDWDHFRRAIAASEPSRQPVVARRPVVGFVGVIDRWVDVSLLADIARRHPEADVVIVGAARVAVDELQQLPNVRLLGRQPFAELPDLLRDVDVALIPFHVNDLTLAVNPIKLREYLAAGVPVVSTALPELAGFAGSEGVDIVPDREAFLRAVSCRLHAPADRAMRIRLSDSMRPESWEGRLEQMLTQLGPLT